jgi:hypothetical protein
MRNTEKARTKKTKEEEEKKGTCVSRRKKEKYKGRMTISV